MTDKPIIFSAPMIRALLEGRKTQTRRIIKLSGRLPDFCGDRGDKDDPLYWGWEDYDYGDWVTLEKDRGQRLGWRDLKQGYAPGDRVWVRETWAVGNSYDGMPPRDINPGGEPGWCGIRYAATDARKGIKDRPSIHMPRWASRLTLTVTDVRVHRLIDISNEDARAEGAPSWWRGLPEDQRAPTTTAVGMFRDLWNNIHGPDAWAANPWVVCLSFDVHPCNIDSMGQA